MKIVLLNGKKNYRSANLLEIKFIISNEFLIFPIFNKIMLLFLKNYYLLFRNIQRLWIVDNYM